MQTTQLTRAEKLRHPYVLMLYVYAVFLIFAFILDSPREIAVGLWKIMTCRSVLISDYMAVGGVGATLVNSAAVGLFGLIMLYKNKAEPNGSLIMALWLSVGFAMLGKNVFNMLPITFGVWLYSKVKKEPFINFTLVALLSATVSPVVSGLSFHPHLTPQVGIPLGIFMGVLAGFIFPAVSSFTMRVHNGYDLYNMGFAGGLISTFFVAVLQSFGLEMPNELLWSSGHNLPMAVLLYLISAGLIVQGMWTKNGPRLPKYKKITRYSGRTVSDFYVLRGNDAFFNMGLLGVCATTVMLIYGVALNGASLCGIFTIIGFGAFGKHLKNVTPVFLGALVCTHLNMWDPTAPSHILAILFSTGLAPIAGQFGPVWGLVTGYLHVNLIMHIGFLNSGLNLYNNGYAAGFVAMMIVPIIQIFLKERQ